MTLGLRSAGLEALDLSWNDGAHGVVQQSNIVARYWQRNAIYAASGKRVRTLPVSRGLPMPAPS
jgi:hypothetical protein